MSKKLVATQELYGIDPKTLAHLPYCEALVKMKEGLLKRKSELTNEMFLAVEYKPELEKEYKRVLKAIKLTELRMEEINER